MSSFIRAVQSAFTCFDPPFPLERESSIGINDKIKKILKTKKFFVFQENKYIRIPHDSIFYVIKMDELMTQIFFGHVSSKISETHLHVYSLCASVCEFIEACLFNDVEIARKIFRSLQIDLSECGIMASISSNWTPLPQAICQQGHLDIINMLIGAKAASYFLRNQIVAKGHFSPLLHACFSDNNEKLKVIKRLIDYGADPDESEYDGNNIVNHLLVRQWKSSWLKIHLFEETLKLLVESGAQVNHPFKKPLLFCQKISLLRIASDIHCSLIPFLVYSGANIHDDPSLKFYCKYNGNQDVLFSAIERKDCFINGYSKKFEELDKVGKLKLLPKELLSDIVISNSSPSKRKVLEGKAVVFINNIQQLFLIIELAIGSLMPLELVTLICEYGALSPDKETEKALWAEVRHHCDNKR